MKCLVTACFACLIVFSGAIFPKVAQAANPWGGGSTQWWSQLGYTGQAQWWSQLGYTGQAWFWDNRYGTANGGRSLATGAWVRYYAGSPGRRDTGNVYAVKQVSTPQPGYWSVSVDYWDDLSLNPGYKTIFSYNVITHYA